MVDSQIKRRVVILSFLLEDVLLTPIYIDFRCVLGALARGVGFLGRYGKSGQRLSSEIRFRQVQSLRVQASTRLCGYVSIMRFSISEP